MFGTRAMTQKVARSARSEEEAARAEREAEDRGKGARMPIQVVMMFLIPLVLLCLYGAFGAH